jgi:tetratricopeptide (TPR) repeat protein
MLGWKKFLLISILLTAGHTAAAQEFTPASIITEIKKAISGFNYDQADNLIAMALNHIDSFDYLERQQVYTYAALRQFQQGDPLRTKEYFLRILELDPNFTLDPVEMSPKIISLFQITKVEYLEAINKRLSRLEQEMTYNPVPWRSLVFPGWEQWHRGYRLKGSLWAVGGTACLIGTLQAVIRTQNKKSAYKKAAAGPEEINALYREYNQLYKSQFYWSYAYMTIWVASHLDALFFSPASKPYRLSVMVDPNRITLAWHYCF